MLSKQKKIAGPAVALALLVQAIVAQPASAVSFGMGSNPSVTITGSTADRGSDFNYSSGSTSGFVSKGIGWFGCQRERTQTQIHPMPSTTSIVSIELPDGPSGSAYGFTIADSSHNNRCQLLSASPSQTSVSLTGLTMFFDSSTRAGSYSGVDVSLFSHITFAELWNDGNGFDPGNWKIAMSRTAEYTPAVVPADPTINTPATFSISGNNLSVVTQPIWNQGSVRPILDPPGVRLQAYACSNPIASAGTNSASSPERFLQFQRCAGLFTSSSFSNPYSANIQPFSGGDLSAAHLDNAGGTVRYSQRFTSSKHIVLVSSVQTTSDWQFSYSASQEYTFVPVVPDVLSQPALTLSGSTVSITQGAWSSGTLSHPVYACPSSRAAVTTKSSASPFPGGACVNLFDSQNGMTQNITDLNNAWVSSGMGPRVQYNPASHPRFIHLVSYASYMTSSGEAAVHVSTASVEAPTSLAPGSQSNDSSQASGDVVRTPPFNGPIVTPPTGVTFAPGGKAVLPGSNLSGVSKVTIAGLDAQVKVNSAGELEITVPSSLKPGVYDLVIVSDSGTLTVQGGLRVTAGSSVGATSEARPSTKLKEDNTVKVHIFDVVGAGKVQIKHNGKEIAWVNAKDSSNSKLTNGYLARTIDLAPGKNVIEVFVDGKRVDRKAYTN